MSSHAHRNALQPGTLLLWYRIDRVLGQGAFGITYLATDTNLHRPVAIKEFLPASLITRDQDGTVLPQSDDLQEEYDVGLRRFIAEARTLAKFQHHSIVRVHNTFEANRTAYMVMQYEDGEGLDRLLKVRGTLTEEEILQVLHPLLDGLEVIHSQGFVHRDIKPANIFIRKDGSPVLLDFGSARQATGDEARTLTNFVSPGYAPIEQYAGKSDQQGPWSDIYGLGATIYRAMTGRAPNDAIERSQSLAQHTKDTFQGGAAHVLREYSPQLISAIDHALSFRVQERPGSVASWRRELPPPVTVEVATAEWRSAVTRTTPPPAETPTISVTIATEVAGAAPADAAGGAVAEHAAVAAERSTTPGSELAAARTVVTRRWARAAAALLPVVALAAWLGLRNRGPGDAPQTPSTAVTEPAPASPVTQMSPPGAVAPAPAASTQAPAPTPAQPVPTGNAAHFNRIADLLLGASADVAALRLTSPPGSNAYEKYMEVLSVAPDNATARQGLDTISDRYVGMADKAIETAQFQRAEGYLNNAEQVTPGREKVAASRARLAVARQATAQPPAPPPLQPTTSPVAPVAPPTPAQGTAADDDASLTLRQRWRRFMRERRQARQEATDSRGDRMLDRVGGRP